MTAPRDLTTEQRWPREFYPTGSLIYDFPGGQPPEPVRDDEEEEDSNED